MPSTFDIPSLFVADKDARKQAAEQLASQSKNEKVTFFGEIGLGDALVKVSGGSYIIIAFDVG
jgi:hypothetical protein